MSDDDNESFLEELSQTIVGIIMLVVYIAIAIVAIHFIRKFW